MPVTVQKQRNAGKYSKSKALWICMPVVVVILVAVVTSMVLLSDYVATGTTYRLGLDPRHRWFGLLVRVPL